MSISIAFYSNASEKNVVDKNIISQFQTSTVDLKDSCSVTDPVLIVNVTSTNTIQKLIRAVNYCYITDFRRYYYVTNITILRNAVFEVSCHVDVLMSYKDSIRSNTAIILRQENNFNLYLNDGVFKCYQNPVVITREFPGGFTGHSYVLAVAGS